MGLLTRARCLLFGHSLYRKHRLGYGTWMVCCRRCERRWGMNDNVETILPWGDVAELYEGPGALFPPSTWTPPGEPQ